MDDREWAHVLLMKLKTLKGPTLREREVMHAFEQIRASEQRRTYHALREAVGKLMEPGNPEVFE